MEFLKTCPICESKELDLYLQAVDNLVSKKTFNVVKCKKCDFIFTNPRPDINEISGYYQSEEYISHNENPSSFFDRIYALIRRKNISYKLNLISDFKKENATLYDYGCGVGSFLSVAQKAGWLVNGYEPSEKAGAIAKGLGVEIKSLDELIEGKKNFDVITLWHVLEHIHDLDGVVEKLKLILKQDGVLVIAVPIADSWDALKYKEAWAALDVPRHLYHFTISSIGQFFRKFGMQIVNIHPLKFDSYYISLLSEKESILKYFRALINGWISNRKARKTKNYSSLIFLIQNKKE